VTMTLLDLIKQRQQQRIAATLPRQQPSQLVVAMPPSRPNAPPPIKRIAQAPQGVLAQHRSGEPYVPEYTELSLAVRAVSMEPRVYQIDGIEWLREHKRGILGDAPGLGKTFQAIEAAVGPTIVTAPLTLTKQWADFINEQYPNDKVVIASQGDVLERTQALETPSWDWMIVNHDMWRKFYMPDASTLIVDEIHHFRNREAQRSVQLRNYAHKRVERVYGLSATPIYKDVGDLYNQLYILDAEKYREGYWGFINRHAVNADYGYGSKVIRVRSWERLNREIAPYIKQRTYAQVGMYLPDRIDKQVVLRLSGDDLARYKKLRDFYILEAGGEDGEDKRFFNAAAALHALRKLTVTREKIDAVKQIVDDTPGDDPIIVFCWYHDTAKYVAEALDAPEITGALKPDERVRLAKTGGVTKSRARVVTMESLSEGADLSDARTVIYIEETYVPGKKYQSLSRVQRFRTAPQEEGGELDTTPVVAYWVRYAGTVDQVVHDTARRRTTGNALQVLREALAEPEADKAA